MSNRAQRRRASRGHEPIPVLAAGDNMVTASLGTKFEAKPSAELPPKVAGAHRWIAIAAYVLSDEDAKGAFDPEHMKFLDNRNLMTMGISCYDCEMPMGPAGDRCPAPDTDRKR